MRPYPTRTPDPNPREAARAINDAAELVMLAEAAHDLRHPAVPEALEAARRRLRDACELLAEIYSPLAVTDDDRAALAEDVGAIRADARRALGLVAD